MELTGSPAFRTVTFTSSKSDSITSLFRNGNDESAKDSSSSWGFQTSTDVSVLSASEEAKGGSVMELATKLFDAAKLSFLKILNRGKAEAYIPAGGTKSFHTLNNESKDPAVSYIQSFSF